MILKGKIQNKDQVWKFYRKIHFEENPGLQDREITNSLKNLSCLLCFRFLIVPKQHKKCKQRFCEECILIWTKNFGFCPQCKEDLTPDEIKNSVVDPKYNTLMRIIKIRCKLGKCLKEDEQKIESSNMPVILEREQAEETSAQEEDQAPNFFWNWIGRRKSKTSISQSDLSSIDHSNLLHSDHINNNQSWSSHNNSQESISSIVSDTKPKRDFSVNDYVLHLVRKHSWPLMEIIVDKSNKKISFVGFKKEKHVKSQGLLKLGPGVIHSIDKDRNISSLVGIYLNDELKKNARIYRNSELIYEGKLINGFYENFGVLKHHLKYEGESGVIKGMLEYQGGFRNGKLHGKGKLYFVGCLDEFQKFFEDKKKGFLLSNLNIDFFKSNESVPPIEKFFLKYSYLEFSQMKASQQTGLLFQER
jgi:hypothetical protein